MEGIKIDLKEYEKFFPDSGSVRINHCKEGDSNRKFYLTRRDEDGIILGYCHHCGGSGSYRLANTRKVRSRKANERDGTINGSDSERDGTDSFKKWGVPKLQDWHKCERWQEPEFSELPIEIRRWWFKNNCSINDY